MSFPGYLKGKNTASHKVTYNNLKKSLYLVMKERVHYSLFIIFSVFDQFFGKNSFVSKDLNKVMSSW